MEDFFILKIEYRKHYSIARKDSFIFLIVKYIKVRLKHKSQSSRSYKININRFYHCSFLEKYMMIANAMNKPILPISKA
jgi:hypothetical protein